MEALREVGHAGSDGHEGREVAQQPSHRPRASMPVNAPWKTTSRTPATRVVSKRVAEPFEKL
jgi:hypothetical protein